MTTTIDDIKEGHQEGRAERTKEIVEMAKELMGKHDEWGEAISLAYDGALHDLIEKIKSN